MAATSLNLVRSLQDFTLQGVQAQQDKLLGGGTSTSVFELEYNGLKCAGRKIHEWLLKNQSSDKTERPPKFEEECNFLSLVRHPNIVQFLGVYFQKGVQAPILVMEFLPTNLTSRIEQYGILPKEISYSILHDVALGLCYLHSQTPCIIHRNLYSNNILLTPNMTAKISDLGKAKILEKIPAASGMTITPGNSSFMPPEAMVNNPKYDTCIDEFSYGVVMIHMFSGQWPEPQIARVTTESDGHKLTAVSEAKRHEKFLQAIGDDHPLMDLICKCIDNHPQSRAHASEIVGRLAEMVLQFPASFADRLEMLRQIQELQSQIVLLKETPEAELKKLKSTINNNDNVTHLTTETQKEKDKTTGQNDHVEKEERTPTSSTDLVDDSQGSATDSLQQPARLNSTSGERKQGSATDSLQQPARLNSTSGEREQVKRILNTSSDSSDSTAEGCYPRSRHVTTTRTGIPNRPRDGGTEEPDTNQPDGNSGTSSAAEQKPTADHSWCTVIKRPSTKPGAIPVAGIQGASGVAVMEALWDKKRLGVRFNQGKKNLLSKWKLENGNQMTTETIISWANTWNILCGASVPSFVDVDTYPDLGLNANIRVDFTDDGVNWSKIGTEATHCSDDFTMQISLAKATNDSLKKHYIIHEFGHALGLGHEHQRSKFWRILYPFVYPELMMHDPHIGGVQKFEKDWKWILENYYTSDLGEKSDRYDPESIMHYWFKVEWLNKTPANGKDYSDWNNVEKDKKDLFEDAFNVLKGLHKRRLHLPPTPSEQDIAFLKKCYESRK